MEAGEIAFLKHTTVREMVESKSFKGVSTDQFQLLCKNGQRMPVADYLQCNWGMVPSNAIVTSSARTIEQRKQYQKFLQTAMKMYSHKSSSNSTFGDSASKDRFNINRFGADRDRLNNPNDRWNADRGRNFPGASTTEGPLMNESQPYESFEMFESNRYGSRLNLMFQVSEAKKWYFLYTDINFVSQFLRIQHLDWRTSRRQIKHSNHSLANTKKSFTTSANALSTEWLFAWRPTPSTKNVSRWGWVDV